MRGPHDGALDGQPARRPSRRSCGSASTGSTESALRGLDPFRLAVDGDDARPGGQRGGEPLDGRRVEVRATDQGERVDGDGRELDRLQPGDRVGVQGEREQREPLRVGGGLADRQVEERLLPPHEAVAREGGVPQHEPVELDAR